MKKYMPSDVFEAGAATIAKAHLLGFMPVEDLAATIWSGYAFRIIDDGVVDDWIAAVNEGIEWLNENNAKALPEFFHHLTWFCMSHDEKGKPRKKRFFDGLMFRRSVQDPERVTTFVRKLQAYYVGLVSGLFQPAPKGWNLGNR